LVEEELVDIGYRLVIACHFLYLPLANLAFVEATQAHIADIDPGQVLGNVPRFGSVELKH
jgi:hypothetical protein